MRTHVMRIDRTDVACAYQNYKEKNDDRNVSYHPSVCSRSPEVAALLKMLESRQGESFDYVGNALRNTLEAVSGRQDQLGDGVIHYLKLAVQAYMDARRTHHDTMSLRGGLAPWQIKMVKHLVCKKMDRNISTSYLAKSCNLSRGHFTRSFKQSMGIPPHRWLQERRVEKAKELLANDDSCLAEVAVQCGFTDQAHFSRVFKVMTNYTPFSWRRFCRSEMVETELATELD